MIKKFILTTLLILFLTTPALAGLEDSSDQAHGNATAVGNAAVSSAQPKFGAGSLLTDGTGDYIYYADHADWNFGTGNWTIDFWWYPNSTATDQVFWCQWNTADDNEVFRLMMTGNQLQVYALNGGAAVGTFDSTNASFSAGNQYHIEFARSGSTCYMFVNGTALTVNQSAAFGTLPNSNGVGAIAAMFYRGTTVYYSTNGYIDEFRISNVARHTSNFTPETGEYSSDANTLLLMHLNTDVTTRGQLILINDK